MDKTTVLKDRERIIIRTSWLSVGANVLLAASKAVIGLISGSIAVVLDALNNLSDVLSSVVTIAGASLANKKPDKKHPLGYGRIEYLSSLAVAAIIFYAGVTAFTESVKKIAAPTSPDFSLVSLIVIGLAVIVKFFLGKYVRAAGKRTDSGALSASGSDALFDSVISASVFVSAVIYKYTGLNLEGFVGVIIACFIIKAAIEIVAESANDILGQRLDRELLSSIRRTIYEEDRILGVYDLILHSYGHGKLIGSVHIEIPHDMTAWEIDAAERRIAENVYEKHSVILAGISIYCANPRFDDLYDKVTDIIRRHDGVLQIHGFYADAESKRLNVDVILDYDLPDRQKVYEDICGELSRKLPDWKTIVTLDVDF
jgi:cation diffusion facilitator family transporter